MSAPAITPYGRKKMATSKRKLYHHTITCESCGTQFERWCRGSRIPRFCYAQCSKRGVKNPASAERMRRANPMWMPGIKQKALRTRKVRGFVPFLTGRGGNGKVAPTEALFHREFPEWQWGAIVTAPPALRAELALPKHLKVDFAMPDRKLAVELDGHTHNSPMGRDRDRRKEAALSRLGWSVLRIKNTEMHDSLPQVRRKIRTFTA